MFMAYKGNIRWKTNYKIEPPERIWSTSEGSIL